MPRGARRQPAETDVHSPPAGFDLDPADWYLAPWRNLAPLSRPEPRPFDRDDALARLRSFGDRAYCPWESLALPVSLTREEAHFWFLAMTAPYLSSADGLRSPSRTGPEFAEREFDGRISVKEIKTQLSYRQRIFTPWVLIPLANLLGPVELVRLYATARKGIFSWLPVNVTPEIDLAEGFARWVLPYLTAEERAELRAYLRPFVARGKWYALEYQLGDDPAPRLETYLAAQLGLHDELAPVIASLPDGYLSWYWNKQRAEHVSLLVFGLADPQAQLAEMRRLNPPLDTPLLLAGWLANTELAGLDLVRDTMFRTRKRQTVEALLEVLGRVRAPEIAAVVVALQEDGRHVKPARKWLETYGARHPLSGPVQ